MKNTALVRVDAQEAFTPEGGLPVAAGREIVEGVNRVTREAQQRSMLIIDTVDFHPERHISFASYWDKPAFSQNPLNPTNPSDLLWTDHGVGGTRDVELIDGIIDPEECVKIYKGWMRNRDAYSAFDMGVTKLRGNAHDGYEVDVGAKTLLEVLHEARIKTLRLVGLVTEVCIRANTLDALENGFDVELVEEGIRGLSPEGHKTTLEYLASLDGQPNRQGRVQSVRIMK
ncbi:MAG: isochorismatase family protein [Candidatus Gracilibacteria bacterium]|nr:isochorismatase family protein [Candidatus Gracilibacteria bacterium]